MESTPTTHSNDAVQQLRSSNSFITQESGCREASPGREPSSSQIIRMMSQHFSLRTRQCRQARHQGQWQLEHARSVKGGAKVTSGKENVGQCLLNHGPRCGEWKWVHGADVLVLVSRGSWPEGMREKLKPRKYCGKGVFCCPSTNLPLPSPLPSTRHQSRCGAPLSQPHPLLRILYPLPCRTPPLP